MISHSAERAASPRRLRAPRRADGPALHDLVVACPPLDRNSRYLYLLIAEHFSDTSIVAEDDHGVVGLVTGYRLPQRPEVLFVWQVAVHARARGQGVGRQMLQALLRRPALASVRWVETTVAADNPASRRLFQHLAQWLGAPLDEQALFDATLFEPAAPAGAASTAASSAAPSTLAPTAAHAAEPLLRIGPFSLSTVH